MKKKYVILIHIIYWIYIINQSLFPFYINSIDYAKIDRYHYFMDVIINTILNVFSFYSIYFTFFRLFRLRYKAIAVLAIILLVALISGIRTPVEYAYWKYLILLPEKDLMLNSSWIWNEVRLTVIIGIYAVLIRFMIEWFETQKLRNELLNQQQSSELALLRSQVNPHFLFNTLNNIYSLVYKKSDEAPAAVMKLSRIMRYVLYDANNEKVSLEKEVEYLKSFIELQELRINQEGYVELHIQGNLENQTISPMLLIPFVENAFKHGGKGLSPGIVIRLSAEAGVIEFSVENHKKHNPASRGQEAGGLGLQNIRRRLELLYPGKHTLTILDEPESFRIELRIIS